MCQDRKMGVLIPEDYNIRIIPNSAERLVVQNLRDRLSDSWKIIPRLDVATVKRSYEVDVLIFHQQYGVIGIEVKGGQVSVREGEWYVGERRLDTPAPRQAQDACYKLRDRVRQSHDCLNKFHIQHAVAMPETDDSGVDLVPLQAIRESLIFQEDLRNIGRRIIALLMSHPRVKRNMDEGNPIMTPQQIEEFVKVVRPTIPYKWDPVAQARDARISLNAIMHEQIRALATLDMNTKVLVHGAAGTGKTQLAIQWTQRAIDRGERVLLTCYNKPLGQHLATLFEHNPNIVVGNFVDSISAIPGMPPLIEPADATSSWYQNTPAAHIAQHGPGLTRKFDTIIIDETQDFYGEWITALPFLLNDEGPQRVLMTGDAYQNLYNRDALDRVGEMFPSEAELSVNCRNTQKIGELLRDLGGARVASASPDGMGVFQYEVNSADDMITAVASELEDLVCSRGIHTSNILIVTQNRNDRDAIRAAMPGGYACSTYEEREDQKIVCETVHRSKGLEFDAVIFATSSSSARDELLYVGLSRAVSLLTVIAPVPILQRLGLVD